MNSRETLMAAATGAVVVSALAWTFVARPLVERWTTARDRVANLSEQLEKATTLVKRRGDLEAERVGIDRALAPSDDLSSNGRGDAIASFLEHLNSLTNTAGFKPRDLKYVRADALDAYAELRFELRARAPLRQIQDFLVRMTASEWYLRVQALQVQPREDGTVEVDMSLVGLASQDALEPEQLPGGKKRREEGR